jgi:hypothetical protein
MLSLVFNVVVICTTQLPQYIPGNKYGTYYVYRVQGGLNNVLMENIVEDWAQTFFSLLLQIWNTLAYT